MLPQHYEVEFLLHQTWEDPRLAHLKEGRLQLFNMRYVNISFFQGTPLEGTLTSSKDLEARHLPDQAWNIPGAFETVCLSPKFGPNENHAQVLANFNFLAMK